MKYDGTELLIPALQVANSRRLVEISDGPVSLSMIQVAQLHLVSHLCSADTQPVVVSLRFASPKALPATAWQELDGLEARKEGGCWELGLDPQAWWDCAEEQSDFDELEFVNCLQTLPNETRVELSFLVDGPSEQCHRARRGLR